VIGEAGWIVDDSMDEQTLLETVGADFLISLRPAYVRVGDAGLVEVPGSRVVMVGDTPVGPVGLRWHPVQNIELLRFARRLASKAGSTVTAGGVWANRLRTWFWFPLEPGMSVIVSAAHNGRGSISVQLVVDDGTSTARIGDRDEWTMSFAHGPTLHDRLLNPSAVVDWILEWTSSTRGRLEKLRSSSVTDLDFVRLSDIMFPAGSTPAKEQNRREALDLVAGRWASSRSAAGGNLLELLFAFCWYLDAGRDGRQRYLAEQSLDEANWVARKKTALWEAIR
jgi:hypothetical protein